MVWRKKTMTVGGGVGTETWREGGGSAATGELPEQRAVTLDVSPAFP